MGKRSAAYAVAFSPLWRYAVGKEYIRFIANLAYKKKKIDKNNQKNKK